jgi:tetratricopeptide (TPR) repeat protein
MSQSSMRVRLTLSVALYLLAAAAAAQDAWSESYWLEAEGDYAAAILALEPVLDTDPNHELAVIRTAWLNYLLGNYNASLRDYERAIELNDQSIEARLGPALPLLAQRRWREAAAVAREVIAVAPWNYYAHLRLLVAEEGQRQWDTLARHARELSTRYPSDATFLVYLARAQARQGDVEAAIETYGRVLELFPAHEEAAAFRAQNGN